MLYSFKNNYPISKLEIPNRIRMPDGTTRTSVDGSSFTEEELILAGWTPVEDPPAYDSDRNTLIWGITQDLSYGWILQVIPDEKKASEVRESRNNRIERFSWRIDRYQREHRLGLVPTDNINELDNYMQRLADIPEQENFPWEVEWPQEPENSIN
jgi:hypothetical protein